MVSEPESMIAVIGCLCQWIRSCGWELGASGYGVRASGYGVGASGYGSLVIIVSAQVLWVLTLGLWTWA